MKSMFKSVALKSFNRRIIPLFLLFYLTISNSVVFGQMGTVSSPFTSLGQAQNVSGAGVYYFNLSGTTFSTYVISGGWVQVAIDFGNGSGNLSQSTALTNTVRGILNPTVLSKLGSASVVKITSDNSSFSIASSNATHITRLVNNQCLHTGTSDNGLQGSWSGSTGSLSSGCNSNANNGLHQRIYHAACNGNGFHWVPIDNNQSLNLSIGELPASSYLQLWVQAPIVAVVNGPTINTQPSSSAQNLCLNTSSTSLSVAATGAGTITYQWYSNASPSNSGGSLITGANSSSFSPPTAVTGIKYYYVVTTNTQGSTTSAVSGAITVVAASLGGTASTNQIICSGTQPANITLAGSAGAIQWQVSTDNVSFSAIPSATTTTLTSAQMGSLTGTRYYRAVLTNSPCSAVNSTVVIVTVTPLPAIISTTPASICGPGSAILGATVASGTINWYAAASGGSSLGTGTSFTTPSISATTTYYVDVVANGCTSARTAVVATINALPLAATNTPSPISAEVLVVGGGGSGGWRHAGGGGGGGVVYNSSFPISSGNISVTVGNGATGNMNDGGNSFFSTITAIGGGGGGSNNQNGRPGGSGGGGSNGSIGGNGTAGQGNKGGNQGGSCCFANGAGGGGAGGAGANTIGAVSSAGGIGIAYTISGTSVYYGGGGGGGTAVSGSLPGGIGGGGAGGNSSSMTGIAGVSNTGGGGGGGGAGSSGSGDGGNGGSGIVIVRYAGTPIATGGTITQNGGYTIHKFTVSGTFTLTGSTSGATVPNVSSCGASTITFTGTVSAGLTLDWYNTAIGGILLSAGTTSYTTPIISTTTTYYVAVRNTSTGCVSATRLAVTATVNSASTLTANQTICPGAAPANITVTSNSGTIQWQSSTNNSSFTNISGQTGATLAGTTIGALYSTMYYRAIITNGACVGNSPVHTVTVSNPTTTATPVSTDLVWNGKVSTDWTNVNNWLSYNGTTYGLAAAIPSNTTNVFIQGTNVCVLNQPTITTAIGLVKNITIESGGTLTMVTGGLTVKGNWVKNGTFTAGTGMVTFNGTTAQTISGSTGTLFANLTVNNTSTGLTLNSPVSAKNSLTMNSGNIATSTANILVLGVGLVGTLNWTAGTVVGPFRRYYANATNSGNSSGLFPVGTASDIRSTLLEYTTAPTSAGYLTVQFKAINPTTTTAGTNGLTLTDQYNWQLDNIATDGYWEISTGMVGGNYNLTLRPKGFSTIGNTFDVCRIIKSPNAHTTWTLDGVHGTTTGTQADFTISRTGMSGFSYFAIAYPTEAPLPIELISFQANCIESTGVSVTWSTASEQNSSYFKVEKSRDGMNWFVLAEVDGAGNSTSILNYEIIDSEISNDVTYYRLKQFDFDGESETFNIASVDCMSEDIFHLLNVYPNPSINEFVIAYNNPTNEEKLVLKMYDLKGDIIYLENKNCIKGSNIFYLNNIDVSPGIYLIEVEMGELISRVKLSIR
jgi:hypothetical protein